MLNMVNNILILALDKLQIGYEDTMIRACAKLKFKVCKKLVTITTSSLARESFQKLCPTSCNVCKYVFTVISKCECC